jgi:tetratricopeptide (TPR) repeat protein
MAQMQMQQPTQPQLKMIFKGRLEFGNQRAYDFASKHWATRLENYFKADILFKPELVFFEEELALALPQPHTTFMGSEKAWRGTIDLFREIVQFAVVGKIQAWCISAGVVSELILEPKTDKAAITEYWLGCELVQTDGGMEDASAALSRAIEKYQRHALAYERRGYVNYKLGNYKDALYDFSKSIDINPNNPEPHYGRGKIRMLKNEWESAAQDFEDTIKRSIPLQPVFWLSRLKKGECLLHAKRFSEAAIELQQFLKRDFKSENPNFRRRRRAWFVLGKSLLGMGETTPALDAFNQAVNTVEGIELVSESEALLYRAIARRQVGKGDFSKDLNAAAKLGNAEAVKLLKELSVK